MTGDNQAESVDGHELASLRRRVTELEQQIQESQQTQDLHRVLIEHSLQGIMIMQDGRIVFANPRSEGLTGYSIPELLQLSPDEVMALVHPDDRDLVRQQVRSLAASEFPSQHYRHRLLRKDGAARWVEVSAHPIEFKGRPASHGVTVDITDQVMAEQAQRELEVRYRNMIDTAEEGIWAMDEHLSTTFVNAHLANMLGCTVDEMLGQHVEAFMFEDQLPDHRAKMEERREGKSDRYERRFRRKDGTTLWAIVSAVPLVDAGGVFRGSFAMLTDITERRFVEEALRESEARFRGVIEQSLDGFTLLDAQGTVIEWNHGMELITGLLAQQVLGKSLWEIQSQLTVEEARHGPDYVETVHRLVSEALDPDSSPWMNRLMEQEIRRADGSRRFIQSRIFWIVISGRRLVCSVMRDITEQKQTEQELQQSEARYRGLFEASPVAMWEEDFSEVRQYLEILRAGGVTDLGAYFEAHPEEVGHCGSLIRLLAVNQATLDLYQITTKDELVLGRELVPGTRYYNEELVKVFRDEFVAFTRGDLHFEREVTFRITPSHEIHALITISIAPGYELTWGRVIVSTIDLSERRRVEEALRQAEQRYRSLFWNAPISLWEEDFSGVKTYLDRLRAEGVADFRRYFDEHPSAVRECVSLIKVLEANRVTLDLFEAPAQWVSDSSVQTIPEPLIFDKKMWDSFIAEFSTFAEGRTSFEGETPIYTFGGKRLWASIRVSIAPGYEKSWAKVFVSAVDLTAQKRAEEQFRFRATLLSQLSDAVISTDLNYVIQDWNVAAETIYGWRAEEVIGQRMGVVIPVEYPGTTRDAVVNLFLSAGLWRGETIQTCKDGTRLDIFSSVSFLRDEEDHPIGVVAINRDITASKRIEQAEHEQRALAEALRDTASMLTSTLNLDEVLDRILSHVVRVVPHDAATVMLVSDGVARMVRGQGLAPQELEELPRRLQEPLINLPNYRQMYDTHLPLVISDTHASADWKILDRVEWIRSFAGAPIQLEGQVIGFLNLYSRTPGFFRPESAGPLMFFAAQAAVALKNARLYNEVQTYAVELRARVEERTAQFRQAKEHVETILNSSSDVIILLSNEGLIRQVNPSFSGTFNCDPDQCLGQPVTMLVAPDSQTPLTDALRLAIEERHPQRVVVEVCYNADIIFDADATLSPIVQADTEVSGVVCSLHDITMLKQTEISLRRMLTREMELGELKSRFIATTSHEFRTPLTIIQSSTDVLLRYGDRLTVEQKEREFQRIRTSIAAMVALLDDILVISRAERGKLEFSPEPLNLREFCGDFLAAFESTSGREHHLVFEYAGHSGEVLLDPKLLRYIVNNLISNAIKYSKPHTTVKFEVSCDSDRATLCVKDEGIGIPQADQGRLFEPFYRAQNVDNVPGTGLGLAIVKQSVDLHRGTIMVESTVGVGTTITVTLPAVQVTEP